MNTYYQAFTEETKIVFCFLFWNLVELKASLVTINLYNIINTIISYHYLHTNTINSLKIILYLISFVI